MSCVDESSNSSNKGCNMGKPRSQASSPLDHLNSASAASRVPSIGMKPASQQDNVVDNIIRTLSINKAAVEKAKPNGSGPSGGEFVGEKTTRKKGQQDGRPQHTAKKGFNGKIPSWTTTKNNIPGLLPTPKVSNSSAPSYKAAFVSDMCDNMLESIRMNKACHARQVTNKHRLGDPVENRQSSSFNPPPQIRTPPPYHVYGKPRTVAEKREFIEQSPVEYQILDNESTVYRLIKKRESCVNMDQYISRVVSLMHSNVPMKRDIWRAVQWLNSEVGNPVSCKLFVDGDDVRLMGSVGVSWEEQKPIISAHLYSSGQYTPNPPLPCCDATIGPPQIRNEEALLRELNAFVLLSTKDESSNSMKIVNHKVRSILGHARGAQVQYTAKKNHVDILQTLKPGPLRSKLKRQYSALATEAEEKNGDPIVNKLGPLEIYNLPEEKISVLPEVHKKQPKRICAYLKLALPDEEMTKEWLEYSLSTVATTEPVREPFVFPVPFRNNQKSIIVRRIMHANNGDHRRCENYEDQMKMPLTFKEFIQNPDDPEEREVADILGQMIDSVAMSYSENSFIADDPDLDYKHDSVVTAKAAVPINTTVTPSSSGVELIKKNRSHGKVITELKRLNATIISAEEFPENTECTNEHCKFGCICESISHFDNLSKHCTRAECIFECRCVDGDAVMNDSNDEYEGNSLQREMLKIRDKKISRLARVEKDFTSTFVVTNSNAILMRNAEDTKRNRSKPKRFDDFVEPNLLDKLMEETPYKWAPDLDRMRHCCVVLPQIPTLKLVEPWCMVHELYRCYCKNQRVFGKRFEVTSIRDGEFTGANPAAASAIDVLKNNRKRQYSFAKDESQDVLQPISLPMASPEVFSAARCRLFNFERQKMLNRKRKALVRENVAAQHSAQKHDTLIRLRDGCANPENVRALASPTQNLNPDDTSKPLIENCENDLGLKISSICSLDGDWWDQGESSHGTQPEAVEGDDAIFARPSVPKKKVRHNVLLRNEVELENNLRQKLYAKLNSLMSGFSTPIMVAAPNNYSFISVRNIMSMMLRKVVYVYEIWDEETELVLSQSEFIIRKQFPKSVIKNILTESNETTTYLAKFLTRSKKAQEANNVFVVLLSTDKQYWRIRGCQFMRKPNTATPIKLEHRERLRDYIKSLEPKTNIKVLYMRENGEYLMNLPLPRFPKTRWLMLQIEDDFSDITHPKWPGLLAYDSIAKAITMAQRDQKTIQVISPHENITPNVYATPGNERRIFIGPYSENAACCELMLYQRIDNAVHLREKYEELLQIRRDKSSVGYWLVLNATSETSIKAPERMSATNKKRPPAHRKSMCAAKRPLLEDKALRSPTFADIVVKRRFSTGSMMPQFVHPESSPRKRFPELQIIPIDNAEVDIKPTLIGDGTEPELTIIQMTKRETIANKKINRDPPTRPSLLKVNQKEVQKSEQLQELSETDMNNLFTKPPKEIARILNELKENQVNAFKLGNTTVVRCDKSEDEEAAVPPAAPGPSTSRSTPESDDDDVVIVESQDANTIIDLDEWEQEQREGEGEDGERDIYGAQVSAGKQEEDPSIDALTVEDPDGLVNNGYLVSNIPNLGKIRAKLIDGSVLLNLPIRNVPIKIGTSCVNRYMMRYINNAVCACVPRDLKMEWEFKEESLCLDDKLFSLISTPNKMNQILTEYGVVDVMGVLKTEEDIPNAAIYIKYLVSRLCAIVYGGLVPRTGIEIMKMAETVIKKEHKELLLQEAELMALQKKKFTLLQQLEEVKKTRFSPPPLRYFSGGTIEL